MSRPEPGHDLYARIDQHLRAYDAWSRAWDQAMVRGLSREECQRQAHHAYVRVTGVCRRTGCTEHSQPEGRTP